MRFASFGVLVVCLSAAFGQGTSAKSSVEADRLLREGITAQQNGNLNGAIQAYRKALASNPDLVDARANLGAALAAAGQFDAAIDEDSRALEAAPSRTNIRMNLALAYYKKGDWRNARTQFERVHAANPHDLSATMLLAYSDLKLGKAVEAVDLLAPLSGANANNTDFQFVYADALIGSGREGDGLPRMEKVAQATNSIDAWVIAGSARLHRREFKEARIDLDAALQLNSNFPGLNTMAGQARDALGDTDAAAQAFEAALRQDPQDATANLYLGAIRLKQRDFESARPLLELALQLQPDAPQARLQMARLNAMTGKYAEAAAALEKLEAADPGWLDPHVELAALYYRLHRPDDGQRERNIVQQLEAKQQMQGPPR